MTRSATGTAAASPGRNRRCARYWPTPATPVGRSGTSSAKTRSSSASMTSPSATRPGCGGTTRTPGSIPRRSCTRRWSTTRCSGRSRLGSRPRRLTRPARGSPSAARTPTSCAAGCTAASVSAACWNNGKPHYRCVFPEQYALANQLQHPRSIYVREELIVPALARWLARAFSPSRLPDTIHALTAAQDGDIDSRHAADLAQARQIIAACDAKLERYRAALEAGTDPALVLKNATSKASAQAFVTYVPSDKSIVCAHPGRCWAPASVRMMASRWLRMVGSGKAPSPVWGRGLGGRGGGVVVTLSWWRIGGYSAVTSATAARVAASSTMVLLVA